MRIAANDPVRAAVARCNGYYDYHGQAIQAVLTACAKHGYYTTGTNKSERTNDTVRENWNIQKDGTVCDNWVVCSFYIMPSGRIELTAYIS